MYCDYGCGKKYEYIFKNGKKCCSKRTNLCEAVKKRVSNSCKGQKRTKETIEKIRKANLGKSLDDETKKKISIGNKKRKISKKLRRKMGIGARLSIERVKNKYKIFFKIEEMRYNPYKPGEKEIQVHCKNHNCQNSKERGGWFTPTKYQFSDRIRHVENGYDGCYFYCSEKCKKECPLYRLKVDIFYDASLVYTDSEYKQFREFVLKRDQYACQYCGKQAEHIHHERPQKLEPFFALDPDLAWSVCKECHYKYGHKDECSTSKIANVVCI